MDRKRKLSRYEKKKIENLPNVSKFELKLSRILFFQIPLIIYFGMIIFAIVTISTPFNITLILSFLVWTLLFLPIPILTANYLFHAPLKKIVFNIEKLSFTIYYKKEIRTYLFSDILRIEGIHTTLKGRSKPWQNFEYSVIILKSGEKIIVTSLFMNQIHLMHIIICKRYLYHEVFIPIISTKYKSV